MCPLFLAATCFYVGLGFFAPAICEAAQAGHSKVRTVPEAVPPEPFRIHSSAIEAPSGAPDSEAIRLLPGGKMTASDKLLKADAESSVAEHAARLGYDLSLGDWTYQQIACASFPRHLFLQYRRRMSARDVTEFSASIPRAGEGRIRIIPILKRSYSLFAPAPVNAITIAAFNHIRAEESSQANSNWAGNALCYAALVGARPVTTESDEGLSAESTQLPLTAQLNVPLRGGEQIQLFDDTNPERPVQWTLFFNRNGQVVKATRARMDKVQTKPVPARSAVNKRWTVPAAPAQ